MEDGGEGPSFDPIVKKSLKWIWLGFVILSAYVLSLMVILSFMKASGQDVNPLNTPTFNFFAACGLVAILLGYPTFVFCYYKYSSKHRETAEERRARKATTGSRGTSTSSDSLSSLERALQAGAELNRSVAGITSPRQRETLNKHLVEDVEMQEMIQSISNLSLKLQPIIHDIQNPQPSTSRSVFARFSAAHHSMEELESDIQPLTTPSPGRGSSERRLTRSASLIDAATVPTRRNVRTAIYQAGSLPPVVRTLDDASGPSEEGAERQSEHKKSKKAKKHKSKREDS